MPPPLRATAASTCVAGHSSVFPCGTRAYQSAFMASVTVTPSPGYTLYRRNDVAGTIFERWPRYVFDTGPVDARLNAEAIEAQTFKDTSTPRPAIPAFRVVGLLQSFTQNKLAVLDAHPDSELATIAAPRATIGYITEAHVYSTPTLAARDDIERVLFIVHINPQWAARVERAGQFSFESYPSRATGLLSREISITPTPVYEKTAIYRYDENTPLRASLTVPKTSQPTLSGESVASTAMSTEAAPTVDAAAPPKPDAAPAQLDVDALVETLRASLKPDEASTRASEALAQQLKKIDESLRALPRGPDESTAQAIETLRASLAKAAADSSARTDALAEEVKRAAEGRAKALLMAQEIVALRASRAEAEQRAQESESLLRETQMKVLHGEVPGLAEALAAPSADVAVGVLRASLSEHVAKKDLDAARQTAQAIVQLIAPAPLRASKRPEPAAAAAAAPTATRSGGYLDDSVALANGGRNGIFSF